MTVAPFGSWPSPIAVEELTSGSVGLSAVRLDDSTVYWLEARPDQGGRTALWRCDGPSGSASEVTPAEANVRTRVHEYGGGEYAVAGGVVVYSEFSDGRVRVIIDGAVRVITPPAAYRYADFDLHPELGIAYAVREDHTGDGECVNTIVRLDLTGENADGGVVLCAGADFFSTPGRSPDGRLAWTQWDHPNMPWDATTIRIGRLDGDRVDDVEIVAGGPEESAVAPRWHGDELFFVSDRTDWWNLYAYAGGSTRAVHPLDAEFADPQWQLGQTPYVVLDDRLLVAPSRGGRQVLADLPLDGSGLQPLLPDAVGIASMAAVGDTVAAIVGYADRPSELVLRVAGDWSLLRRSNELQIDPDSVSRAVEVSWDSPDGPVHGWYYPPTLADVSAPADESPPMITRSHGGPTACAVPTFRLGYQFWTSRGIALLDVNYGGSTGYGRAYRNRLRGTWGEVDTRDCIVGAASMGERGLADPRRLVVEGGSAGGYTTLRALTTSDAFATGISLYGVGDLEALATDTHKFESRYLDGLIGPYPEARALYLERSPIHHVDQLAAPILLLQGTDDKVVPPNQAVSFADAARAKKLPVALVMFEGEGHGFRRADSIKAAAQAEVYFLGRILDFTPADDVPAIPIDNLD